ncbi:MAG: archease [Candidatus Omnitrophota bacterium]|nr:archease [Candidatus Omnitrophota bacterium]
MKRYEQIPHTADIAAKIYGKDLSGLFENAAFAMFDMMADLGGIEPEESVNIKVEAPDREGLLISWLNEILYVSYIKGVLFTEFHVGKLEENRLAAEVKGQKLGDNTGRIHTEIKAATYHDVAIRDTDDGYTVTVVFDV